MTNLHVCMYTELKSLKLLELEIVTGTKVAVMTTDQVGEVCALREESRCLYAMHYYKLVHSNIKKINK